MSHSVWINLLQTSKTCMFNVLTTEYDYGRH